MLSGRADLAKEEGESSLITAIRLQDRSTIRYLLKNETWKCEQNHKALFVAISCKLPERAPSRDLYIVNELLRESKNWERCKLDVDDEGENGLTLFGSITEDPLMLALLVSKEAIDLSAKDKSGKTVLDYAVEKKNQKMISYLKDMAAKKGHEQQE